ncbi:DUF2235 domain-containing protein [Caballeronia sp. TF1N1]|uniref:DUF2235 domain-containing protein n=1 Tax=Caballeronia sp. TF1N1 TaxID=2878153 RepID=UPI001FD26FB8|nr:DUF2235 domain-containing protein [Caballeronia sp. TF1N1]
MANTNKIDAADRTPLGVLDAIGANTKAYPSDDCIPCGAVIHIGFFFDGFGRHRDHDDVSTSRYSNICRLWEAHRENEDRRREKTPNQFWYRLYYSGLGTDLNKEAKDGEIVSALTSKVVSAAQGQVSNAKKIGEKITGIDRLQLDPKSAITDGFKKGLEEHSYRPVVDAYDGLVKEAKALRTNAGRVLRFFKTGAVLDRGRAAGRILAKDAMKSGRQILFDLRKNPLKVGWAVAGELFKCSFDVVPVLRDNSVVARLLGTGVEPRLQAAKTQFEKAIEDARARMPKVQHVKVSVFGADRGCVLARALLNDLSATYKHPSEAILEYKIPKDPNGATIPIEIVFVGLLDAVSSLVQENALISMVPLIGAIKQNYGDQMLGVPQAVQRCVHFAAAHELRFYQRLDSLENTRGLQYLYPGTSEDITGGAPPGSLGARAELQRVVLRDMLNEAISYGGALDCMEDLAKFKPKTFQKFTLANPITDGRNTYKIWELMKAYREMVPYVARLNFVDHMQVFLRWMAVRYTSSEFRATVTNQFDALAAKHEAILKERNDATAAYLALRKQFPVPDSITLGKAQNRMEAARSAEMEALRDASAEKARPSVGVWERIQAESTDMIQRDTALAGMRRAVNQARTGVQIGEQPYDADPEFGASIIEEHMDAMISAEQQSLVQAWKMGLSGKNPLPPKVMALFDLLVHDTMLTSWQDHVLSSSLYFRLRGVDTFGSTDYEAEEKARKRTEENASRASQINRGMNPAPRPPARV